MNDQTEPYWPEYPYDPSRVSDTTAGELSVGDVILAVAGVELPSSVPIELDTITIDGANVWLNSAFWDRTRPIPVTETILRASPVWALGADTEGIVSLYGSRRAALAAIPEYAEELVGFKAGGELSERSDGSAIHEAGERWLEVIPMPLLARKLHDGETA